MASKKQMKHYLLVESVERNQFQFQRCKADAANWFISVNGRANELLEMS